MTLPDFDLQCPHVGFAARLRDAARDDSRRAILSSAAAGARRGMAGRLGAHDRLRVGLVWSGNPAHDNDRNRSMPFAAMSALLDDDASFFSLQKDPRPDDKALLSETREIVDLTAHLTDFVETAALIACLDLVITVDTSVAHLAGRWDVRPGSCCPTRPTIRWLLDRDDSPWYPSVRLFRQERTPRLW